MSEIDVVQYTQKVVRERQSQINDVLIGGSVKNMEQYRECMGELRALEYVLGDISRMLENQELIDG